MTKTFLHRGQDIFVAAAFGIEQDTGSKAGLGQAGSEQVAPAQGPEHGGARLSAGPPPGDSGDEQAGGAIITYSGARTGKFVQGRSRKATAFESGIERFHSERQHFARLPRPMRLDRAHLGTQCGKALFPGMQNGRHNDSETPLFSLCSDSDEQESTELPTLSRLTVASRHRRKVPKAPRLH